MHGVLMGRSLAPICLRSIRERVAFRQAYAVQVPLPSFHRAVLQQLAVFVHHWQL